MNKTNMLIRSIAGGALLALAIRGLARKAAQAAQAPQPAGSGTPYAAFDAFIEGQMRQLNIPGVALAIVEGDHIAHLRGFGRARPGGAAPAPQTPFFIGSLTKSFTALAVMQLVEAGKINLDAPVQHCLPWFTLADPQAASQITARHLLNQTSGLSTWAGWVLPTDFSDHPGDPLRMARGLATVKLIHPPGAAYEYSNLNFDILGLMVEAASGETYADYVQSHIFKPLGMQHTYTSQAAAKRNGLAAGHRFWFWAPFSSPDLPLAPASLPSGGLISSTEDLARYLIAQLNEGRCGSARILSPEGIAEMHRPAAAFETMGWSSSYGMGWYAEDFGQMKMVWHSGMVPDFSAFMAILPEQKKGFVLLFNADHFMMNPVITEVGHQAVERLTGQQSPPGPLGFRFARLVPWIMRALLLLPLLQILGIASTLRQARRWTQNPRLRPSRGRLWLLHILLPLIPNLGLAAVPVYLQRKNQLGFLRRYAPDFSWTAILGGAFAAAWGFLRAALLLRSWRKARTLHPTSGRDTR